MQGQCLSELGWRRTVNTCPMACQWRLRGLLLAVLLEQRSHTLSSAKQERQRSHSNQMLQDRQSRTAEHYSVRQTVTTAVALQCALTLTVGGK